MIKHTNVIYDFLYWYNFFKMLMKISYKLIYENDFAFLKIRQKLSVNTYPINKFLSEKLIYI